MFGVSPISIHSFLAESDHNSCCRNTQCRISIHSFLAESDMVPPVTGVVVPWFQSTASLQKATECLGVSEEFLDISIHSFLAESDSAVSFAFNPWSISIHSFLAESDIICGLKASGKSEFQSTASSQKATDWSCVSCLKHQFQSTASSQKATKVQTMLREAWWISIHSFLAESDTFPAASVIVTCGFQSTASSQKATPGQVLTSPAA